MNTKTESAGNPGIPVGAQKPRAAWLRLKLSRMRAKVERALHPGRRRRAHRHLRARQAPTSVLFVCEGNIYRSPYAAACLSAMLAPNGGVRIASAGFKGPDRSCPPEAQVFARSRGYDLSTHRSRLLDAVAPADWDLIVVMDAQQADRLSAQFGTERARVLVLGDLDPEPIDRRGIADPWKSPELVLAGSYARVERCVREFAASCWGNAEGGSLRS